MIRQNPFSLYDFLGYLIPGAITIYSYLIIAYFKSTDDIDLDCLIESIGTYSLDTLFLFIVLSYTLGHLLSFLSSISIENYGNRMYGYPSKYILGIDHDNFFNKNQNWKSVFWRSILIIILFPIFLPDLLLGRVLGLSKSYAKSLDEDLKNIVINRISQILQVIGGSKYDADFVSEAKEFDFNRIISHYAYEHTDYHHARMSNYVALYGFLRTLALIFNSLFWYVLINVISNNSYSGVNILILSLLILMSYILFMAFMKFYRRYTLEGIMIVSVEKNNVANDEEGGMN